jgi:hypothetical protein
MSFRQKINARYFTNSLNSYQMFSGYSMQEERGCLLMKSKFNMEMHGADSQVIVPLKVINDSIADVWGYGWICGQAIQFIRNT